MSARAIVRTVVIAVVSFGTVAAFILGPAGEASARVKPSATCQTGTLNPQTGQCESPATTQCPAGTSFDGTSCTDGPACPAGETFHPAGPLTLSVPTFTFTFPNIPESCLTFNNSFAVCPPGSIGLAAVTNGVQSRTACEFVPSCPAGTTPSSGSGTCTAPATFSCPTGSALSGQSCSAPAVVACAQGTSEVDGFCVPEPPEGSLNDKIRDQLAPNDQPMNTALRNDLASGNLDAQSFLPDNGGSAADTFVPGGSVDSLLPGVG